MNRKCVREKSAKTNPIKRKIRFIGFVINPVLTAGDHIPPYPPLCFGEHPGKLKRVIFRAFELGSVRNEIDLEPLP